MVLARRLPFGVGVGRRQLNVRPLYGYFVHTIQLIPRVGEYGMQPRQSCYPGATQDSGPKDRRMPSIATARCIGQASVTIDRVWLDARDLAAVAASHQ